MNIYKILILISLLVIPHLSFAEYRDNNYQARLQDVMKARKLMDKKRERDKINDLAQELAKEMVIIDTHLDTPIQLYMQQDKNGFYEDITKKSSLHFDFDRAVSGGLNVPFFVIFTPPSAEEKGTAFEMAKDLIKILEDIMNKNPGKFRLVKSPEEITNEKNIMQVVYGMENGAPIESKLSNIKLFSDSDRTIQVGTNASVTIKNQDFVITASHLNINEGETLSDIHTIGINDGTTLYWSLSGNGISSEDFLSSNNNLIGSLILNCKLSILNISISYGSDEGHLLLYFFFLLFLYNISSSFSAKLVNNICKKG